MSRHQQEVIAYLVEENRVLREQMGNRGLKVNDDQRRRLAAKAKKLGPENVEASGDHRRAGNSVDVAPKSDWSKARWQ